MATGMTQTLRIGAVADRQPRGESRDATGSAAAALFAEAIRPEHLPEIHGEAKALAGRTLEPNAFYEPSFLANAMHHFGSRASIVLIWDSAARTKLLGLFPLALPRLDLAAPVLRGWLTPYMTNGAPLIDRTMAEAVLIRFMRWVETEAGRTAAVIFPGLSVNGPVAALLRAHAARTGRMSHGFEPKARAVIGRAHTAEDFLAHAISPKKAKELRRQRNRLAEQGQLAIRTVTDRALVRDAFEHFLAIEARSWKGRAGTAMMQQPAAAAFSRAMVRAMASEGQCRIDLLELDGAPIAAAIQLRSGDRSYFWKTAYDAQYAKYSPGLHLAIELSVRNLQDETIALTDSCAEEGHPMIDELWDERIMVADLLIAASPDRRMATQIALKRETTRRSLRTRLKGAYRALRKR